MGAIAVFGAAVLAGCSSSGGPGPQGSGEWAKAPGTIVFGAVPDKAGSDANNKPLEDYLAKQTGYTVEYYPTNDYTALIAAASAGKVDVMSSGALQYVQATNKGAEVTPVAAALTSPGITDPGYFSEAIVPQGSPITSLAQVRGKKVCFVDQNSTSGFLFGLFQLSKAGLDVAPAGADPSGNPQFKDFTAYFAGAHDKSEQAVAAKQCDVGFAEDTVAEPGAQQGQVTVIGKEYVPGQPLSVSTKLPDDAKQKITTALQGATLPAIQASGVPLTDGFRSSYFGAQPKDAGYYRGISDLCTSIAAAKCAK